MYKNKSCTWAFIHIVPLPCTSVRDLFFYFFFVYEDNIMFCSFFLWITCCLSIHSFSHSFNCFGVLSIFFPSTYTQSCVFVWRTCLLFISYCCYIITLFYRSVCLLLQIYIYIWYMIFPVINHLIFKCTKAYIWINTNQRQEEKKIFLLFCSELPRRDFSFRFFIFHMEYEKKISNFIMWLPWIY